MLRSMFGIGGSEILVILVVALLFLGPDKLPDAAKTISKGIRDLKRQSRALQNQIEGDHEIGGAIRDLKSALRGDDFPARPPTRIQPKLADPVIDSPPASTGGHDEPRDDGDATGETVAGSTGPAVDAPAPMTAPALTNAPAPSVTLPPSAGELDPESPPVSADELGHLIKPATGTVAKKHG